MGLICRKLINDDICIGHGVADYLTGDDAIIQTVRCELRFILGEWFLDTTKGVPWIRNANTGVLPILGRFPADLSYAEVTIKAAILRVDGVLSLTSFALDFNHNTRAGTCRITGTLDSGNTFTITEGVI
jgi:hypothetical protein